LCSRHKPAIGSAYNFGPEALVTQSVGELIEALRQRWPGAEWQNTAADTSRPEARLLRLSCDKALAELDWHAVLTFEECMAMTGDWYRQYYTDPTAAAALSTAQVAQYVDLARARGLAWAAK